MDIYQTCCASVTQSFVLENDISLPSPLPSSVTPCVPGNATTPAISEPTAPIKAPSAVINDQTELPTLSYSGPSSSEESLVSLCYMAPESSWQDMATLPPIWEQEPKPNDNAFNFDDMIDVNLDKEMSEYTSMYNMGSLLDLEEDESLEQQASGRGGFFL
jgi:hypothetical protein